MFYEQMALMGVLTVIVLMWIGVFSFWLIMLIDCIKRQNDHKLMWILLLIFVSVPASIIYYFLEYKKRK